MGEKYDREKFFCFLLHVYERKGLCVKIVVFNRKDLDFARAVFTDVHQRFGLNYSQFYLSQGNPYPPGNKPMPHYVEENFTNILKGDYLRIFDLIKDDPVLSKVKFLPQLHVWLYGNRQGV
jgi:hypothetical protein